MGYYQDLDEDRFGSLEFEKELDEKFLRTAEERYYKAKRAETKTTIECPCCGKSVIKTTYHKKFCSTACKDKYWNFVNPRGIFSPQH